MPTEPDAVVLIAPASTRMRDRLPAQGLMELVVERYDARPPRGRLARALGVRPLPLDDQAWLTGAIGEMQMASYLHRLPTGWSTFHSAPIGSRDADIDHVVVGPAGIFTINTKHHRGKRIWVGGATVMVNGSREQYIPKAEAEARRLDVLLSKAGFAVPPAHPIIALVGARDISVKTRPRLVHIDHAHRIVKWLTRRAPTLEPSTVAAVAAAFDSASFWRETPPADQSTAERFAALRREVAVARVLRLGWTITAIVAIAVIGWTGLQVVEHLLHWH